MKLISKFHDYYDTALAEGRDETIVYVRKTGHADVHLSPDLLPWAAPRAKSWRGGAVGPARLLVTDTANRVKTRPPYRMWRDDLGPDREGGRWVYDEAFAIVAGKAHAVWVSRWAGQALLGEEQADDLGSPTPKPLVEAMKAYQMARRRSLGKDPDVKATEAERSEEDDDRTYAAARERFLAHDFTPLHLLTGAPVLLAASPETLYSPGAFPKDLGEALRRDTVNLRLITNPCLAALGFQRALPPYTCFQLISQFIDGVIPGRQMPMATISDASQVRKKGFDPIYGFRTRPGTKA